MNKKLLIVGSFPSKKRQIFGGVNRSCQILLNSSITEEFEVIPFDSSQISNPPPNIFIRSLLATLRLFKLLYVIRKIRPQVSLIFCSDGASALEKGVMLLICKSFKIRTLIFPRAGNLVKQTNMSRIFKRIIKNLFNQANVFLCQGPKWEDYARKVLDIKSEKLFIIENWTATPELLRIGRERIISEKQEKIKLLYVGWLEKEKGVMELVNAINLLVEKRYDIHLRLIGDGNLRNKINKFIIKNNLSNNITIQGWTKTKNLQDYYLKSDIFILPSWQEGMPNALIEAISTGLPSVTTSVGVISNYLKNNKSTILVEPNNTINLEKSIEKLINDVNLRQIISKNGILIAEKYFYAEKSINKLTAIIKKVIQNN